MDAGPTTEGSSGDLEPEAPPRIDYRGELVDRALEAAYRRDALPGLRRYLRFSLTIASVVFLAYGVHDWLVVPSVHLRAWAVRYGIFLPTAALVLALVGSRHLARWGQAAMLLYGMAANVVVLYIGVLSPLYGFYLYTSYSVLFVTLGPFVARMSVSTQVAYTALTMFTFNLLAALYSGSPLSIRISISVTLLSLGGIGALLAYQLDRKDRESFLQRRVIQRQVEALGKEKARSEELLLNVLPPSIADRLKSGQSAIADGFAQVSVLFADIVGFTRMSARLQPEELVGRLNRIFSSFDDLVDKLHLEKIKTIGDAYMVAGGLHSHEYDHANAIAEMALAMRRRAAVFSREFHDSLDIRIGIHTGPVVAGVIGKRKFIYDVWGDTVNTASRMESHSKPGNIQVTEDTYKLLQDLYDFEPRGEIEVKGKGRMRTWFLIDHKPDSKGRVLEGTQLPRKVVAG
jgi:class 3 adenylate cyclase